MKISKETEQQIAELQLIEQNLQNFLAQTQNFQMQLAEIESALKELGKTKEVPFKIVGQIMIAAKKEDLIEDLSTKKEIVELRMKSIEKQESQLKEKAENMQKEIMKEMKQ